MSKREYHTKSRGEILKCLDRFQGGHFTAADVVARLAAEGSTVAPATVYRTLDRFTEDGTLRKYIVDGTTAACYQREPGRIENCREHFHLKCEKCGRLIHMECEELSRIADHLRDEHGVLVDSAKTVFYGVCGDCRKAADSGARG